MGLLRAISREHRYLTTALRALNRVKTVRADSPRTVADDIEKTARKHPRNTLFWFGDDTVTYAEFEAAANQIGRWALDQGFKPGDTVALFMLNRPEYITIWYGLAKVGVVTALLNNQLSGPGLAHCIDISEADHLIVDHELSAAAAEARPQIGRDLTYWAQGGAVDGAARFDDAIELFDESRIPPSAREGILGGDTALKMFTSGTTGLPKAAKVTHVRALNYMNGFAAALKAGPKDRMLMVLPLYHATGGLCGVGCALTGGGGVVLEKKFSASNFWDVATDKGATLFTYVGELCRFLAAAEPHPKERAHKIRGALGNGMRPDVWERFQRRFGIPWIMEFYGATEGNASLINFDGHMGAVGRVPSYLKHRFNVDIVKFDLEKEEPVRGGDGLCVRADFQEAGELIGEIREDDARFRFDGYEGDETQTKKKVMRDVFKKGDMWFRTGDLLRRDKLGYFYFVDRVGDTFRWKAENVATSEVSEALSVFDGVKQANVYGVEVPGYDGRAGMAAIVAGDELDLVALHAHVNGELPHFARPVFLRIQSEPESDTTGTFKFKKMDLVRDGFDPSKIEEPVYFDDPRAGAYVRLSGDLHKQICAGDIRL